MTFWEANRLIENSLSMGGRFRAEPQYYYPDKCGECKRLGYCYIRSEFDGQCQYFEQKEPYVEPAPLTLHELADRISGWTITFEAFVCLHDFKDVNWYGLDTFRPVAEKRYFLKLIGGEVGVGEWKDGEWVTDGIKEDRIRAYYPVDGEDLD